jgi:ornithine cyclodeaminase
VKLARNETTLPGVIHLDIPAGEVHVKGAYLHGTPFFSIKEAGGFYKNPERGLPSGSGAIFVFDAVTGFLRAILFDNAYLTELRTGAAGALAADLLSRPSVKRVGIFGSGGQARYQLEALLGVRRPEEVVVTSRSPERMGEYAREMTARFHLPVRPAREPREAVSGCDIVVTTTPSRQPVVFSDWVDSGTHVTAVGSDGPDKQELEASLLARAQKVVVDRLDQCLKYGELHHAVEAGLLLPSQVYAELGEVAAGLKAGRTSEDEITVADLTGVGIQDAAVANHVVLEAETRGVGQLLEV